MLRISVQIATNGLTCSGGIAPSRLLAKICSDQNKPNGQMRMMWRYTHSILGQTFLDETGVDDFLEDLAIRKIPGIGRVQKQYFNFISLCVSKYLTFLTIVFDSTVIQSRTVTILLFSAVNAY